MFRLYQRCAHCWLADKYGVQRLEEAGTGLLRSDTLAEEELCEIANEIKVKEERRSKESWKADDSDSTGIKLQIKRQR